eukprot:Gb_20516 [translate_table: standard]
MASRRLAIRTSGTISERGPFPSLSLWVTLGGRDWDMWHDPNDSSLAVISWPHCFHVGLRASEIHTRGVISVHLTSQTFGYFSSSLCDLRDCGLMRLRHVAASWGSRAQVALQNSFLDVEMMTRVTIPTSMSLQRFKAIPFASFLANLRALVIVIGGTISGSLNPHPFGASPCQWPFSFSMPSGREAGSHRILSGGMISGLLGLGALLLISRVPNRHKNGSHGIEMRGTISGSLGLEPFYQTSPSAWSCYEGRTFGISPHGYISYASDPAFLKNAKAFLLCFLCGICKQALSGDLEALCENELASGGDSPAYGVLCLSSPMRGCSQVYTVSQVLPCSLFFETLTELPLR